MPRQLIYTSAPRGLVPGQSGYCTVARSRDLREALIPRLEKLSYYTAEPGDNPIIRAYRILEVRGDRYHVLTRIVAAGLDFTRRSRFLAHHLIFDAADNISPAQIFLEWQGWRDSWNSEPQWTDDNSLPPMPDVAKRQHVLNLPPEGLWISVPLTDPTRFLKVVNELGVPNTFTTFYQPGDDLADFALRAVCDSVCGKADAGRLNIECVDIDHLQSFRIESEGTNSKSAQDVRELPMEATGSGPFGKKVTFADRVTFICLASLLGWLLFYGGLLTIGYLTSPTPPPASQPQPPVIPERFQKPVDVLAVIFPERPTWLVLLSPEGFGAPKPIGELERLFKQLQDSEIFSKDIQVVFQSNLQIPGRPTRLDADLAQKRLRCLPTVGTEVALRFDGKIESLTRSPIALEIAGARLLIIPAAAPIYLSPRWLARDEGREAVSLAADLENRLRQITLPAGAELALRPTVDPFAGAQKEFSIQPSTSLELLAVRADVAKVVGEKEKKIEAMKTEHAELLAADKRVIAAESESDKLRKKRLTDLSMAMPKAAAELKLLRDKEARIPETLRGISAFSLFLCQSNVNSEIIRFTEAAAP
jgi:hypothetical protein